VAFDAIFCEGWKERLIEAFCGINKGSQLYCDDEEYD
tara:strand:+ start:9541 stop:9651 length:111 start_codon:yes stop_codon:yes gene_type:complete